MSDERKRERLIGLALVLVSFCSAVGISWKSKQASMPHVAAEPAAPDTSDVAGFPNQVVMLPNLSRARGLTPRSELIGISASGVGSEGVDVAAGGSLSFQFRSHKGEGPEPERSFGRLARRHYCGLQEVVIASDGIVAKPDNARRACKGALAPLAPPTCSLKQLWEAAVAKGMDPGNGAQIEYYQSEVGPAWRVHGSQQEAVLAIGADCKTFLSPEQAQVTGAAQAR